MAENRRNRFSFDRNYYENYNRGVVEGSAARKAEVEYEEDFYDDTQLFTEEYSEEDFRSTSPRKKERKNRFEFNPNLRTETQVKYKKKYNFGFIKLFMIAVLSVAIVKCCYTYIEARADIIQANRAIATAKAELKDIRNINDSLLGQLDVETDRNYIYTIAVSKLNMIYPKENDTIYYEKPDEGYVRQYYEIP